MRSSMFLKLVGEKTYLHLPTIKLIHWFDEQLAIRESCAVFKYSAAMKPYACKGLLPNLGPLLKPRITIIHVTEVHCHNSGEKPGSKKS